MGASGGRSPWEKSKRFDVGGIDHNVILATCSGLKNVALAAGEDAQRDRRQEIGTFVTLSLRNSSFVCCFFSQAQTLDLSDSGRIVGQKGFLPRRGFAKGL